MSTQSRHAFNPVMRDAINNAKKRKTKEETEKKLENSLVGELRDFCSANNISIVGDHRNKKTFIDAIIRSGVKYVKSEVPVLSIVPPVKKGNYSSSGKGKGKGNHLGFIYPANLVKRGEKGKYRLYFNKGSGMEIELVVTEEGKRRVRILSATGSIAYLVKDNAHKRWYVPYAAIENKQFSAPKWMSHEQKRWIVSAMKTILQLHDIFQVRVNRKKELAKTTQNT